MDKLNRPIIFKEVAPKRFQFKHKGWEKSARHQRPIHIVAPRINASNQCADEDLQKREMHHASGHGKQFRLTSTTALQQIFVTV